MVDSCAERSRVHQEVAARIRADRARVSVRSSDACGERRRAQRSSHIGAWNPQIDADAVGDRLYRQLNSVARVDDCAFPRRAGERPAGVQPEPTGPARKKTICFYTFACSHGGDPHPTDAGYRAMANAFFRASGY